MYIKKAVRFSYVFLISILVLLILSLDIFTIYILCTGKTPPPLITWKILIINLMLAGGFVLYWFSHPSRNNTERVMSFFKIPLTPEPFTFNTFYEFIGMVLISMSLASLIKLWTPKLYLSLGIIPVGIVSFSIYVIACTFIGIALNKLMLTFSRHPNYIYWPVSGIAFAAAYYIFGAGFDLVQ